MIRIYLKWIVFFSKFKSLIISDNSEAKFLAQYLAELTLLDAEKYLHFAPSVIGAASVALSRHIMEIND